jgi:hypothetical protein
MVENRDLPITFEVPRDIYDAWTEAIPEDEPAQQRIIELIEGDVDMEPVVPDPSRRSEGYRIEIDEGTSRFRPQQPDGPVTITIAHD